MTNVPIVIRKWVCLTIYLFQAPILQVQVQIRLPACRFAG
jgi:hypothetical protein